MVSGTRPVSVTSIEQATVANIRAEMARRGVTQAMLGERIGVAQTQVSARLRGRVQFTLSELDQIADALGVPLFVLLTIEPEAASA